MKKLLVILMLCGVASAAIAQTAAPPTEAPDTRPEPATGDPPPPPAALPADGLAPGAQAAPAPAAAEVYPVLPIDNRKCKEGDQNPKLPQWIRDLNEACWTTAGNFWFPVDAAKAAKASDFMFYAVLALSAFFFFGITACIIYFVIKYRHRPGHKAQPSSAHNDVMEITWTIIPSIICVFLFVGGWRAYIEMYTRPPEPTQIKVTAKKWNWDFEYPNGLHLPFLVVPKDKAVELQMTSVDVLHSYWVPAFRTKMDVVPRRYTYVYFTATREGVYRQYCTEYCGKDHSLMKTKAIVLDYNLWLRYLTETKNVLSELSGPDLGKLVYETKGCKACHSVDGSRITGPTWKGTWGTDIPLEAGGSVKLDAEYVKTAINEPGKQIHQGYPPTMPPYAGQLSEAEISGVAAYIESLK